MDEQAAEEPVVALERLRKCSDRLHRCLREETVLTRAAIQYRLCETGPIFGRMDPREVHAALRVLANNPEPAVTIPHGPWEPKTGIYVSPAVAKTDSRARAAITAAAKEDQLRALAAARPENRGFTVASEVCDAVAGAHAEPAAIDEDVRELLGGTANWNAGGALLDFQIGPDDLACAWITNNITWVFPDDAGLWRHLVYCAGRRVHPIVIGRKLALATFPVLKRAGAVGLQLHHLYLAAGTPRGRPSRALNAGPPPQSRLEVRTHVAVRKYLVQALEGPPKQDPSFPEALSVATEVGLHSDGGDRLALLREWSQRSPIAMPVPWKAQLTRYERWANRS